MPTPQQVTSTTTDLVVWEVDNTGTVRQDGGIQLKTNASPEATPAGHVQLYSPDGASLSTMAPDGSGTALLASMGGNALGSPVPANQNLVAWAYDPVIGVNSSSLTNGTVYLSKLQVAANAVVSKIYMQIVSAAVTPTGGENVIGLYSSSGSLLTNASIDTAITSTGLMSVSVPATAVVGGQFYWAAIVVNAATPPALARAQSLTGADTTANVGLSAATYRFANNGTGKVGLPGSITPASNTMNSFAGPWAAIG